MYEDKYNPNLKFYDNEEESTYLKAYKEIISKTADLLKYIKRHKKRNKKYIKIYKEKTGNKM